MRELTPTPGFALFRLGQRRRVLHGSWVRWTRRDWLLDQYWGHPGPTGRAQRQLSEERELQCSFHPADQSNTPTVFPDSRQVSSRNFV
jgi:hypothetical protein